MSGSLATRPCPACGAICPRTAELCYACKKRLPDLAATPLPPEAIDLVRARLAAASLRYPSREEQHGSLRWRTLAWLGGVVVPILIIALADDKAAKGLAVFPLVVCVWPALWTLVSDLAAPSPRRRATPERAARAFFAAIRRRHWDAAFDCLSPIVHGQPMRVPALPTVASEPATVTLAGPTSLTTYWRTLAGLAGGRARHLQLLDAARVDETADGLCRVRVKLRLVAHPTWALYLLVLGFLPGLVAVAVTQIHVDHSFEVLAHPRGGQWWLVGGDLPTGDTPSAILQGWSVKHDA